ncbi:RusA family crossover junction endodeoxyribonuclease [Chloroflexota bacterium]
MIVKKIGKTGSPPFLQLEDSIVVSGNLGELKTGDKYRKDTINVIKTNLSNWMANNNFEPIRGQQLDLAVVIKLSPYRFKKQDADNIAKVICDASKRRKGDNRFLFNDDSQIIRLLIWKIQRVEDTLWETDSYDISFRVHDSSKSMILIHP